jgi:hypothetical protein
MDGDTKTARYALKKNPPQKPSNPEINWCLKSLSETVHDVQLFEGEYAQALHQSGQPVCRALPLSKVFLRE